jgi:hypothetical protein
LLEEWGIVKLGNVVFYRRLASFFKDYFPSSLLAADLEKELLIRDLDESGSFAATHSVVAKLSSYRSFDKAERNAIVTAAIENSQVRMIVEDADVSEFMNSVVGGHEDQIDASKLAKVQHLLKGKPTADVTSSGDETICRSRFSEATSPIDSPLGCAEPSQRSSFSSSRRGRVRACRSQTLRALPACQAD